MLDLSILLLIVLAEDLMLVNGEWTCIGTDGAGGRVFWTKPGNSHRTGMVMDPNIPITWRA